ncbi:fatty aldehyde dehydrogenase [Endogone sp. FLAS-F59071]|nr:fatty aldehyde dehydrogenase [Endogone sp. FLAS-F59071]|eukprot:RUS18662.1 fatty aldehyde dehydrogenase [Endogone sp. FLAS-F59071]
MSLQYTPIEDLPNVVDALNRTFLDGVTKPLNYRKEQLRRLYDLLDENEVALVKCLYDDLRKPEIEVIGGEIAAVKEDILFFLKNLDKLSKPEKVKPRYLVNAVDKLQVRHVPLGLVLIMGAWNYPVNLLLLPFVGAIAAGNTVILKPSEIAVHTAATITSLLPRYLDERSYRIVNGGVPETTRLLEYRFDHIFYTGNGNVGRIVMTAAAKHLTPVTLELGGKTPVIIAPDADLQVTANRVVWGKLYNCGQTCIAADYVLIPEAQLEPFLDAIRRTIDDFFGADPQKSDSYGRIVSDHHFTRLFNMIDRTSGRIILGGQHDKAERYIAPTVITGIDENDPLLHDEIFGPILPVVAVKDVDAAVEYVNAKWIGLFNIQKGRDTPLALYLFAKSSRTISKVLDNTRSGGVLVNDTLMHYQELSLPFGGVGPSGMGNYHGVKSWQTFTHERATMIKDQSLEVVQKAVKYPPYTQQKLQIVRFLTISVPWFKRGRAYKTAVRLLAGIVVLLAILAASKRK